MIGIFLFSKLCPIYQEGENVIKKIIENFRIFMLNKGLTQEEAAAIIGCSQEHLSRILNGRKTPSVKLLMKMEEVMENERN